MGYDEALFIQKLRRRIREDGAVSMTDLEDVFWEVCPEEEATARSAGPEKLAEVQEMVRDEIVPDLVGLAKRSGIPVRG